MATYTALLHDGTVIQIEDATYSLNLIANFNSKGEFEDAFNAITDESLKTVEIQRDDVTVGTFYNNKLRNVQIIMNTAGRLTAHFYIEEEGLQDGSEKPKTFTEQLTERVERLESGQDVQDGAIEDLGMAISEIAEGQEA